MSTVESSLSSDLAQCFASDTHYAHWLPGCKYTEGVQMLASRAGAYWLIDVVFSHFTKPKVRREPFQLWSIRKLPEGSKNACVVECRRDRGLKPISRQFIPYTDFPFDDLGETFEWYVDNRVMLLKSEY